MCRHAAQVALEADVGPVTVVLGAHEGATRALLAGLPVEVIVNPNWEAGLGTSIKVAIAHAAASGADAAIVALADQPYVKPAFFRRVVEQHQVSGKPIVAARYAGTVGVPALFAKEAFPWLLATGPNRGCKGLILAHPRETVTLDCPEAAVDIDTPAEYSAAIARGPRQFDGERPADSGRIGS